MDGTIQLDGILTNGSIKAEVIDLGTMAPSTVIHINDQWHVNLDWEITGNFQPKFLGGSWTVQAFLERFGPGADLNLTGINPVSPVNFLSGTFVGPNTFRYHVEIANGTANPQLGIYTLGLAVRLTDNTNTATDVAGFVQGPMIEFIP